MKNTALILYAVAFWPLAYFLVQFLLFKANEKRISLASKVANFIGLAGYVWLLIHWISRPNQAIHAEQFQIMSIEDYAFNVNLYFDKTSAVFLGLSSVIGLLIVQFSSFYMHLEKGFFRFYSAIQLFLGGFTLVVMSGNLETLLLAWELLGLASFLLIAFYRDRYLPARNAVRVVSLYRIGDLGILIAMWASHHYWHQNVSFYQMEFVRTMAKSPHLLLLLLGFGFLLAACVKSAQFPFSTWLPRAMEGPTPSSAIFYGALSIHLGAFLLLRTSPFWLELPLIRLGIGSIGLLSFLLGFLSSLFQPTIKAKIAYQSIMHLGLIFIEIAANLHVLALVHVSANAIYQTHRLLSSPSIINIKMRKSQFVKSNLKTAFKDGLFKTKLGWWIYANSLKDWNLDLLLSKFVFGIPKRIGIWLHSQSEKVKVKWLWPLLLAIPLTWFAGISLFSQPSEDLELLPVILGLFMVCYAFTEIKSIQRGLVSLFMANLFLLVGIDQHYELATQIQLLHLSGIVPSFLLLLFISTRITNRHKEYSLSQYNGLANLSPGLAVVFLIALLMFIGFPISPTFIGEDLLFSKIDYHDYLTSVFTALIYVLTGITGLRYFARSFLGHPFSNTNLKFN